MKRLIIILTFFLIFINIPVFAASSVVKNDIKVITDDGFSLHAILEYPKVKGQKEFSTVVLLHSLGYSSQWWDTLPEELLNDGFAVLRIDLRGHGASVYNSKLVRVSWKNLTKKAYAKYPDDVLKVINYVQTENKRVFFNNWAVVGCDIGASAGVIAANKIKNKPKTIVMLSPVVQAKGLYIPIQLAELDNIDILSISGVDDIAGQASQEYLKKFAQATFSEYTSESKASGMVMLKNDKNLSKVIVSWLEQYLKQD